MDAPVDVYQPGKHAILDRGGVDREQAERRLVTRRAGRPDNVPGRSDRVQAEVVEHDLRRLVRAPRRMAPQRPRCRLCGALRVQVGIGIRPVHHSAAHAANFPAAAPEDERCVGSDERQTAIPLAQVDDEERTVPRRIEQLEAEIVRSKVVAQAERRRVRREPLDEPLRRIAGVGLKQARAAPEEPRDASRAVAVLRVAARRSRAAIARQPAARPDLPDRARGRA